MGRGLAADTRRIIDHCRACWETDLEPENIVPTVRQYFYLCAVAGLVEKSQAGYARVQVALARARERGDFPWEAVFDGLRQLQRPQAWSSLDDFCDTVRSAWRLDRWADQPRAAEVWIEKDTVRGTVAAVVEEYGVPLLVARGYASLTAKFEASHRIAKRPTTILYIGDHDPSGVDMREGAEAWIRAAAGGGVDLAVEWVAVTDEDREDPTLLRVPLNVRDSRARQYLARYGDEVVEVEALSPSAVQRRLARAIEACIDWPAWQEAEAQEDDDRQRLEDLLEGAA